jgi:hypothetical protein
MQGCTQCSATSNFSARQEDKSGPPAAKGRFPGLVNNVELDDLDGMGGDGGVVPLHGGEYVSVGGSFTWRSFSKPRWPPTLVSSWC